MEAKRQKRKFINDYLKFDGVFILRMISMLTSELVGTEVLHELWSKRAVYEKNESLERDSSYQRVQSGGTNNQYSLVSADAIEPKENPFKEAFKKETGSGELFKKISNIKIF